MFILYQKNTYTHNCAEGSENKPRVLTLENKTVDHNRLLYIDALHNLCETIYRIHFSLLD